VYYFRKDPEMQKRYSSLLKTIEYREDNKTKKVLLDEFLQSNGTTAFIIIKNDTILYEKYFNGFARSSMITSFSISKSFLSALLGIAIEEGHIKSVDEHVTDYIPELKERGFQDISVRHLLGMSSGIKYTDSILPWKEKTKSYYWPDLRQLVLNAEIEGSPGEHFKYNEYNPLVIGMLLERATHRPVSVYLQEKIWKAIGMEYPASWSMDSKKNGFEKMGSGINARAIDFAKFGRLYLHRGIWNGRQIVPEKWVVESTSMDAGAHGKAYYGFYDRQLWKLFFARGGYYKFYWWGYRKESGYDFFAAGNLGQYVYVCPDEDLIIVRFGRVPGHVDWWPEVLRNLSRQLG
jgi:CubicO group peptidase (beta-lactamase class C family)